MRKIIILFILFVVNVQCKKIDSSQTTSKYSNEKESKEPTIEQSRDDMNPNWQTIEMVYEKPFNKDGYGLSFYSGSDKYGYENFENKVVFIFSETLVEEIKKYKDFNSLTMSEDIQSIVSKMADFNRNNQSKTKKVTFIIE